LSTKRKDINAEKKYFDDSIAYTDEKLAFYDTLQKALKYNLNENDTKFFDMIETQKEELWTSRELLVSQQVEINEQVDDLTFQEFAMDKRHSIEDEKAAKEDETRIKKAKTLFSNEKTELAKLKKEITDVKESDRTADQKTELKKFEDRLKIVDKRLGEIDGEIEAEAKKQKDAVEARQKKDE
jgi:hypothetical protein